MIVVMAMFGSVKDWVMRIPIVRMLQEQRVEREQAAHLIQEMTRQQAENERRLQILDWMTYPHTTRRTGNHDPH